MVGATLAVALVAATNPVFHYNWVAEYKYFIKNAKSAPKSDTSTFLNRPYLWYN